MEGGLLLVAVITSGAWLRALSGKDDIELRAYSLEKGWKEHIDRVLVHCKNDSVILLTGIVITMLANIVIICPQSAEDNNLIHNTKCTLIIRDWGKHIQFESFKCFLFRF